MTSWPFTQWITTTGTVGKKSDQTVNLFYRGILDKTLFNITLFIKHCSIYVCLHLYRTINRFSKSLWLIWLFSNFRLFKKLIYIYLYSLMKNVIIWWDHFHHIDFFRHEFVSKSCEFVRDVDLLKQNNCHIWSFILPRNELRIRRRLRISIVKVGQQKES